jgi:hypothetical protein
VWTSQVLRGELVGREPGPGPGLLIHPKAIEVNAESNLEPILCDLRALLPDLRRRYGVETLEVFGSRVRADAYAGSALEVVG